MRHCRHIAVVLAFLPLLCDCTQRAEAQEQAMAGTDFWVSFMLNNWPAAQCYYITVASPDSCTAHIENIRQGWDTTVTVQAGGTNRVRVPFPSPPPAVPCGQSLGDEAWHVSTTAPAMVYASNYIEHTHDMAAILPTASLRCDYMTQTYSGDASGGPVVYIAAPYDSTVVRVSFAEPVCERVGSQTTQLFSPGDSISVLLLRGQCCRLRSSQHGGFSGTRIHSSKPVAVFQGNILTCVPGILAFGNHIFPAQDHLYEQAPPTECWGTRFLVFPTSGRTLDLNDTNGLGAVVAGDMVKVTALANNCRLSVGDSMAATLSAGETYTFVLADHPADMPSDIPLDFYQSDALPVVASSPVMVCLYIASSYFGGYPGDPAMVVVPPIEQCIVNSIVPVYNSDFTQSHVLNIAAPNDAVQQIRLDGQSVASSFSPAAFGFSRASIPVDQGMHTIDGGGGRFQAVLYGLGDYESYAMVACMATRDIRRGLRVSSNALCLGDTATAVASHSADLSVGWLLDGEEVQGGDTVRLVFESAGVHRLAAIFSPIGDTLWETVTVAPWPSYLSIDSVSTCPHEPFYWNGLQLDAEGIYADTMHTVHGCDSVEAVCLIYQPLIELPAFDTICYGDTLEWHGHLLSSSGVWYDTLPAVEGCDTVVSMSLTLRRRPDVDISVTPSCVLKQYTIRATVDGDTAGAVVQWRSAPADASLALQPWYDIGVSPTTATLYTLTVVDKCLYDTSFWLQPILWPVARMEVRPERIELGHPVFDASDVSLNANSRVWLVDGRFVGDDRLLHYVVDPSIDSLLLTLVAINEACADTLTRAVYVDRSDLWVPNIFTPDKVGNNLFAPILNRRVAEEMFVYNRNGLLVFHVEGDNPVWDGTCKGVPCEQGAYVWVLRYHSVETPERHESAFGTVTLVR